MVFIGPYEHHSNELPWRESIADVVVIDEDADGRIDLDHLAPRARPPRGAPAQDRQLLGRVQRDRHRLRHARARRPAAPPRRAGVLRLRRGGPLRRHRDEPGGPRRGGRRQGRGLPLAPQVHRRPGHAGRARGQAAPVQEPGPRGAGGRHGHLRQRDRAPLRARRRPPRGGRHPRDRRVDPRRPGLPAQARGGRPGDPREGGELHPPRRRLVAGGTRASTSWATRTPSGSPSSRS